MTRMLSVLMIALGLLVVGGCGEEEPSETEDFGRQLGEEARELREQAEEFGEGVREGYEEGEQEQAPAQEEEGQ